MLFRLQPFFRRRKIEAELSEEMRAHLEMATDAKIAAGMSPEDARHAAQREFGGVDQVKESYRDERGIPWIEDGLRDLRFAVRSLWKNPGFTAVAVLSLAVAISVNATVFSLINGLILRPLVPLRPAEVVNLYTSQRKEGYRPFSHTEYLALREARDSFADVAASYPTFAGVQVDQRILRRVAFFASENYFSILGITPSLGRFFNAAECRPNANIPVIVASHAFWQSQGGHPDFLGSILQINGKPYTVIGIAPDGFSGLNVLIATDFWAPLGVFTQFGGSAFGGTLQDLAGQKSYNLFLTARLAPGVTLGSLKPRLPALAQRLPDSPAAKSAHPREIEAAIPSRQNVGPFPTGADPTVFLMVALFSISGCVLLIASLNLANLLLALGAERAREIALRRALGATRWRIIRQLLTEGLVIACTGGGLGFLLSLWVNTLLLRSAAALNYTSFSLALNLRPDALVIGVTFLFCLVATLFSSLAPALRASRADLVHDLQHSGGGAIATNRLSRFFAPRQLLVMIQIALSLALLFSGGLFIRGALRVGSLALGFDPAGCLVAELDYSLRSTPAADLKRSLFSVIDLVHDQPGVQSVAASTLLPYGNLFLRKSVQPATAAGRTDAPAAVQASYAAVTAGYFGALGVRLLRGRDFTAAEARNGSAASVAIIDESLAGRLFPNGDALGQRIHEAGWATYSRRPGDGLPAEMEIVGICASHRHDAKQPDLYSFYVPYASAPALDFRGGNFIFIRYATNDPAKTTAAIAPLRAALRALDPDLPLVQLAPFATLIGKHSPLWEARISAVLFGAFGAIALVLAIIGVYGMKSYAVSRQTREIGIRMALGAQPCDLIILFMQQGVLQTAVAIIAGALLALAAGQMLGSYINQVSPTDPFALGGAALLLAACALLACWIPARRAARVDPAVTLRAE